MKKLLLIRHAKSSWDFNVDDLDRPLNHRGKTDAPEMARRLLKREVKIDTFITSPAERAHKTAVYFGEEFGVKAKNIITIPSLYEPTISAFQQVINNLDDDIKRVAIFSHNPAITEFANSLSSTKIDDMPTCAVFAVKADVKKWSDLLFSPITFWFFDYPKAV